MIDPGLAPRCRASLAALVLAGGCASVATPVAPADASAASQSSGASHVSDASHGVVWAINVGGGPYTATDGIQYEAEVAVRGGQVGRLEVVKGSQDPALYREYRTGNIEVTRPIANGVYDVTFYFAEPEDIPGGARLFDVFTEDQRVIKNLDVMASRDGKVFSALTVTTPGVEVTDGVLDVRLTGSVKEAVLSALVVRKARPRQGPWQLVWSDEFDGDTLDASKWTPRVWPARKVNDEDQAYTARPKNLRIEDGHLIIEAHKEVYDGAAYTSGRIFSKDQAQFLYGRFEIRAKLPRGKGTWPALWMLPADPFRYATTCKEGEDWQGSSTCDAWPNSGEIDIMEHVGYQMGHIHGTVHNEAYYWAKWEQRKGRVLLNDVAETFHVYALEWTPDRIDAFVDDTHYFSYVNEGTGWRAWPYDHPYRLILNVAVGGAWGRAGGGIDDNIFPQRMLVDYVRVYSNRNRANETSAANHR